MEFKVATRKIRSSATITRVIAMRTVFEASCTYRAARRSLLRIRAGKNTLYSLRCLTIQSVFLLSSRVTLSLFLSRSVGRSVGRSLALHRNHTYVHARGYTFDGHVACARALGHFSQVSI